MQLIDAYKLSDETNLKKRMWLVVRPALHFSSVGFDLFYRLLNKENIVVAHAKTGMICYDYSRKKIAPVPDEVKEKLETK